MEQPRGPGEPPDPPDPPEQLDPLEPLPPAQVTAILLCGGRGSRLGGEDKPLLRANGQRLVDHVIAALRPQVGRFVISCGRDAGPYLELGHPTVADLRPGDGPLGGIASALPMVETDWLLTYPGDAPFPHPLLVRRLAPVARASGIAVPSAGGHRQNLVLLLSQPMAEALALFYREGGRAVRDWLDQRQVQSVDMTDAADSFFNVNTPADLVSLAARLAGPAAP